MKVNCKVFSAKSIPTLASCNYRKENILPFKTNTKPLPNHMEPKSLNSTCWKKKTPKPNPSCSKPKSRTFKLLSIKLSQHMMILSRTTIGLKEKSIWSEERKRITKKCKEFSKNNWKKSMNKLTKNSFHSTKRKKKSKNSNNKLSKSRISTLSKGPKRSRNSKNWKKSISKMPTLGRWLQVNWKLMSYWRHLLQESHKWLTRSLYWSSDWKRSLHQTSKN